MRRLPPSVGAILLVAAAPAASTGLTTVEPLDELQRCITAQLVQTGKPTAINTAAGVLLDFSFQTVGVDGKVTLSHVAFAIDDLGTQRRVAATAADPADAALAQQLLHETAKACLPADDAHGDR